MHARCMVLRACLVTDEQAQLVYQGRPLFCLALYRQHQQQFALWCFKQESSPDLPADAGDWTWNILHGYNILCHWELISIWFNIRAAMPLPYSSPCKIMVCSAVHLLFIPAFLCKGKAFSPAGERCLCMFDAHVFWTLPDGFQTPSTHSAPGL